MKVTSCAIADVLLIEPRVFGDERGFFFESFNQRAFNLATGLAPSFVQDNHSRSARGVLRGLHYQLHQSLARCLMWPSTFDATHPRSGSGPEKFCPLTISASYGCHLAWRTASWCYRRRQSFCTKRLTTTHRNSNVALPGTILIWALSGQHFRAARNCRQRTQPA